MKTILVVDDDLAIREFLSDALAAEGYRVLAVGTGRRAFEIAKEERPDLVLADVMLPDLSGRELIRRIKGNEDISSTPVIVMSAALPSDAPGRRGADPRPSGDGRGGVHRLAQRELAEVERPAHDNAADAAVAQTGQRLDVVQGSDPA